MLGFDQFGPEIGSRCQIRSSDGRTGRLILPLGNGHAVLLSLSPLEPISTMGGLNKRPNTRPDPYDHQYGCWTKTARLARSRMLVPFESPRFWMCQWISLFWWTRMSTLQTSWEQRRSRVRSISSLHLIIGCIGKLSDPSRAQTD
jgi:hypothetical protein